VNFLTLDVAGRTGWAVGSPGDDPLWGAQQIALPNADPGAIFAHYDTWLRHMIHTFQPELVFAEMAFVNPRAPQAVMRLAGYKAITQYRCFADDRRLQFKSPAEITSFFVGRFKQGTKKNATIARCRQYGWEVDEDDDAADALALWVFAEAQLTGVKRQPIKV